MGLGMAISTRSMGTRLGPTIMGWILPGPIKNRVGFGFFKKKPKADLGWVRVLVKLGPNPDPTRPVYNLSKITKIPIYIYIYHLCQTLTHFSDIS